MRKATMTIEEVIKYLEDKIDYNGKKWAEMACKDGFSETSERYRLKKSVLLQVLDVISDEIEEE